MAKPSKPPEPSVLNEFADVDDLAEPAVPEAAPDTPPPAAKLAPEASKVEAAKVVVHASAPRAPASWRVVKDTRVSIRACLVNLKAGHVLRADHYDNDFITNLRRGGVELERIS